MVCVHFSSSFSMFISKRGNLFLCVFVVVWLKLFSQWYLCCQLNEIKEFQTEFTKLMTWNWTIRNRFNSIQFDSTGLERKWGGTLPGRILFLSILRQGKVSPSSSSRIFFFLIFLETKA